MEYDQLMSQVLPKGYSSNSYPRYPDDPTHKVIPSSIPVYTRFPDGDERYSPSGNSDIFYKFLQEQQGVIVLDDNLGPSGQWSEILIPGDLTTGENNYFIYNPDDSPSLEAEHDTLPTPPLADNITSRDYSFNLFSYATRRENKSFFDASYQHYAVKITTNLETIVTLDNALEQMLVQGAKTLASDYNVILPNITTEYLTKTYSDFFRIIDYSLDVRGDENTSLSRLTGIIAIKTKYFDRMLPVLYPTTEEIAAQSPGYRDSEVRINEYVDVWLDPSRSPLTAEDFLKQYSANLKEQADAAFDFKKSFSDIASRGSVTPFNILDIISQELSELPVIGSSWIDNQRDQARSEQAVATQDLETAISDTLSAVFAEYGIGDDGTRKRREELQKLTAMVIATGTTIEDLNSMIIGTINALNNSPDFVKINGSANPLNWTAGTQQADLLQAFTAALDPNSDISDIVQNAFEFPNEQAIRTISESKRLKTTFANFFEDKDDVTATPGFVPPNPVEELYPLKRHPSSGPTPGVEFYHDNIFSFSNRKDQIKKVRKSYETIFTYLAEIGTALSNPLQSIIKKATRESMKNFYGYDNFEEFEVAEIISLMGEVSLLQESPYKHYSEKRDIFTSNPKELTSAIDPLAIVIPIELAATEGTTREELSSILRDTYGLNDAIKALQGLRQTYDKYTSTCGYILGKDIKDLYELAGEIVYQSTITIPSIHLSRDDGNYLLEKYNKSNSDKGLSSFYDSCIKNLDMHNNAGWSYTGISKSKIERYQKETEKYIKSIIESLVPSFAYSASSTDPVTLSATSSEYTGPRLNIGYNKNFKPIYVNLTGKIDTIRYQVFAYQGAKDKGYDLDEIAYSGLSRDSAYHLYNRDELSKTPSLNVRQEWREFINKGFPFSEISFRSPSEQSSLKDGLKRTFNQGTRGRTLAQSKEQIRMLSQIAGDSSEKQTQKRIDSFEEGEPSTARYVVDNASEIIIDGQGTIFEAVDSIGTSDELFEKFINHLPVDIPAIKPLIKCLLPSINLEKIIKDTEQYKLIKDTLDSILAVTETAGSALNVYETLEAALAPPKGADEDYLTLAFYNAVEKVINLLILKAFKIALEQVQILCLKWQAFLMEAIASALFKATSEDPPSLDSAVSSQTTGALEGAPSNSPIGEEILFSLSSSGYSEQEILAISSPESFQYIEDLSKLLSPSEFCQLLTKTDSPEYLRDIAFGLYDSFYQDTDFSGLKTREKLMQFLYTMGEQIDPQLCEALSSISRLPTSGYSHTVKYCSDNSDIEKLKEDIILKTSQIDITEARKIIDAEKEKDADSFKNILSDIESQTSGTKTPLDLEAIFDELPEVINERKIISTIDNSDLYNALTQDAGKYYYSISASGKQDASNPFDDVDLGPLGNTYQKLAQAMVQKKLTIAYPELRTGTGSYPEVLQTHIRNILWKDSASGEYTNEKKDLANAITEASGVAFSEDDIDTIRFAVPQIPLRKLISNSQDSYGDNLLSPDSSDTLSNMELKIEAYLSNLKRELEQFNLKEKQNLLDLFREDKEDSVAWKPIIGLLDLANDKNIYYSSLGQSGDYEKVIEYLDPNGLGANVEDTYNIGRGPGHKISPTDYVTTDTLYYWFAEKTREQALSFHEEYRLEQNEGDEASARMIFIGTRWPEGQAQKPPSLLVFEDIDVVKQLDTILEPQPEQKVYEDGKYDTPSLHHRQIKLATKDTLSETAPHGSYNNQFVTYIDDNKYSIGGVASSINSTVNFGQHLPEQTPDFVTQQTLKRSMRDLTSNLSSEETFFAHHDDYDNNRRLLTHLILKQNTWNIKGTTHFPEEFGQMLFETLDNVRKNLTTQTNKSVLKNKFPDIVRENFLDLFGVQKITSSTKKLQKRFKSHDLTLDNALISSERRDYNLEEKLTMWTSITMFIRTFVTDYILKMLPLIMTSNFFNKKQDAVSKDIILSNLELFLKEERGPEFEIFKKKFLYTSNAFWLFLQQEPCSVTDLSSYENIFSAAKALIGEAYEEAKIYIKENELYNVAPVKQRERRAIIEVPNTSLDFHFPFQTGSDTKSSNQCKILAKSYIENLYDTTFHIEELDLNITNENTNARNIQLYNSFYTNLDQNGIFYIDNYLIKKLKKADGTITTTPIHGWWLDHMLLEEEIIREYDMGYIDVSYHVVSRLNFITPKFYAQSSYDQNIWPRNITERIEPGLNTANRILVIDEFENPDYFYSSGDPFNDARTLFESPHEEGLKYIKDAKSRMQETISLTNQMLLGRPIGADINNLLSHLAPQDETEILRGLMYYSLYDYYDGLGIEDSFYHSRTSIIDTFMKADARGTKLQSFILNPPSAKKETSSGQGIQADFLTHYSAIASGETIENHFSNISSIDNTNYGIPILPSNVIGRYQSAIALTDEQRVAVWQKTEIPGATRYIGTANPFSNPAVQASSYQAKEDAKKLLLSRLSDAIDELTMTERRIYIKENKGKTWLIRMAAIFETNYTASTAVSAAAPAVRRSMAISKGNEQFAKHVYPDFRLAPILDTTLAQTPSVIHELGQSNSDFGNYNLYYNSFTSEASARAWNTDYAMELPTPPVPTGAPIDGDMHESELKDFLLTESKEQIDRFYISLEQLSHGVLFLTNIIFSTQYSTSKNTATTVLDINNISGEVSDNGATGNSVPN